MWNKPHHEFKRGTKAQKQFLNKQVDPIAKKRKELLNKDIPLKFLMT